MRKSHYLRHNAKNEMPSQFICVDTETLPTEIKPGVEEDTLWFGWACFQRARRKGQWCKPEWFRFDDKLEFWRWVKRHMSPGKTTYLFCHNTSYDLPVLSAFKTTRRLGLKLRMAIIDAPPTILKWTRGKSTLKCLDTLNWWRTSLAKLGENVGCPKLEMPDKNAPSEKWDSYCKNDVEVLRRAMLSWWDFLVTEDLGNFRPTLASQAMGCFKHRFMDTPILAHTDEDTLRMERAAYHGGRCECFKIGRHVGRFTLVDVNSMYPAVMRNEMYPTRLHWCEKHPTPEQLARHAARWLVVADVTIETESPAYGVVHAGKLVFPVGRFRTVLTTNEVRRALSRGEVIQCHAFSRYDGEPCFTRFVEYFNSHKVDADRRGDKLRRHQFKILENSLYGKFGQTGRVWEKHAHTDDESTRSWIEVDVDAGKVRKYRQLAGLVQSFEEQPESFESCPAIAAHVTANARMLLLHYIETAGQSHVYYCDTDSLLVDDIGLSNLRQFIDPDELGKLKIEGEWSDIEIWGAKDYRFGDKVRHKGIRAKATQLADNQWKQWQWSSLIGLLNTGQIEAPRRRMVTKTLKRDYTKGLVLPNNDVMPLRINSDVDPTALSMG